MSIKTAHLYTGARWAGALAHVQDIDLEGVYAWGEDGTADVRNGSPAAIIDDLSHYTAPDGGWIVAIYKRGEMTSAHRDFAESVQKAARASGVAVDRVIVATDTGAVRVSP